MTTSRNVSLKVAVPVCSFRKGYAREFFETEVVPPPSTVYCFLLSLVGEESRYRYIGTRIAYALLKRLKISTILRTAWRFKTKDFPQGIGSNRRPDYQEILTGLKMVIWISCGELADRIIGAGENFAAVKRYGGLSLGESRDMVNEVIWFPQLEERRALWLTPDEEGDLPLPVWVDHVGSKDTIWQQFKLEEGKLANGISPEDKRWIVIRNQNALPG